MLHSLGHLSREHLGNQEEEIEDHNKRFRKKARSLSSTVSSLDYLALLCVRHSGGRGMEYQRWTGDPRASGLVVWVFVIQAVSPSHATNAQTRFTGNNSRALVISATSKDFLLSNQNLKCLRKSHGAQPHLQ